MKCIALAGFSALRASGLVDDLIAALTIDGCTVSAVKRAPDDFDLDQPGKWSHLRREAGCGEVLLVGARRFALLHEFRAQPVPPLADLPARPAPVDIVLPEGFRDPAVPTTSSSRPKTRTAVAPAASRSSPATRTMSSRSAVSSALMTCSAAS